MSDIPEDLIAAINKTFRSSNLPQGRVDGELRGLMIRYFDDMPECIVYYFKVVCEQFERINTWHEFSMFVSVVWDGFQNLRMGSDMFYIGNKGFQEYEAYTREFRKKLAQTGIRLLSTVGLKESWNFNPMGNMLGITLTRKKGFLFWKSEERKTAEQLIQELSKFA